MTPKDAFDTILESLKEKENCVIVRHEYDQEMFGNFVFSYLINGDERSITSDRGQVFICSDLEARKCYLVVEALYYTDPDALKKALSLL